MHVKFPRHAKRRADLYKISESTFLTIFQQREFALGIHEIVENVEGMKLQLKLVIAVEDDIITVMTTYPLKKGHGS